MKVIFRPFSGPHDWGWVQMYAPILRCGDTNGIMAIDIEKNETVGAVIFDNWTPNGCQSHVIITNPLVLRHGFAEEVFKYVFITSGRKMMLGFVRSDNLKALKFDRNLGFEEIYRLKDGFEDGVDIVAIQLLKENCRFIQKYEEKLKEVA